MNKVTAIMTIFNGEQFLPAVLESLNKLVDKLIVVEGCVKLNNHSSKSHTSSDNSLKIIRENAKKLDTQIITNTTYWKNKAEMLNRALELVKTEWILLASDDEVYHEDEIKNIRKEVEKNEEDSLLIPHYHFWKGLDKYITGYDWDVIHLRLFKVKKGDYFTGIETLTDKNGIARYYTDNGNRKGKLLKDVHIYHYAYCKSNQNVLDKTIFYLRRKGSKSSIEVISQSVKLGHGFFKGKIEKERLKKFLIENHPSSIKKLIGVK